MLYVIFGDILGLNRDKVFLNEEVIDKAVKDTTLLQGGNAARWTIRTADWPMCRPCFRRRFGCSHGSQCKKDPAEKLKQAYSDKEECLI
jgi:hypothetical protein